MSDLDKKILHENWKQSQLSIQILRGTISQLVDVLKALGEIKTVEEMKAFEKIERLISEALDEIDLVKKRFWEVSIESMKASKN